MPAKIEGLENVLANIRNIIPTEIAKMNSRIGLAGDVLETNVKLNASLTDHTLEDLAKMGHPYSKKKATDSGPHPDDIVHNQSGTLYGAIQRNDNMSDTVASVEVGVSESDVSYIKDLITGTPKMRPRNFLAKGLRDSKDNIQSIIGGD
ncbi:hypothetical protein [Pectinatus frisingensis]|uniref:hypothetical protein n=1 Tax=Pectinatus frisingensis TaxID=865 RepID=UPI0018C5C064|nr:hypothetical protein [Pectinatus frisingensis]